MKYAPKQYSKLYKWLPAPFEINLRTEKFVSFLFSIVIKKSKDGEYGQVKANEQTDLSNLSDMIEEATGKVTLAKVPVGTKASRIQDIASIGKQIISTT